VAQDQLRSLRAARIVPLGDVVLSMVDPLVVEPLLIPLPVAVPVLPLASVVPAPVALFELLLLLVVVVVVVLGVVVVVLLVSGLVVVAVVLLLFEPVPLVCANARPATTAAPTDATTANCLKFLLMSIHSRCVVGNAPVCPAPTGPKAVANIADWIGNADARAV
jgi:hypothetical protein